MSGESSVDWNEQYKRDRDIAHHRMQNQNITNDFLIHAVCRPVKEIVDCISSARSIAEHGCGTGELSAIFASKIPDKTISGYDYTVEVKNLTFDYTKQLKNLKYDVFDLKSDISIYLAALEREDLCIISNVLEHFGDWDNILNKLLSIYQNVLVIVPYRERLDKAPFDNLGDGGVGHVVSFDENSFNKFNIIKDMIFFSLNGWGVSWAGECPLQYAILLKGE